MLTQGERIKSDVLGVKLKKSVKSLGGLGGEKEVLFDSLRGPYSEKVKSFKSCRKGSSTLAASRHKSDYSSKIHIEKTCIHLTIFYLTITSQYI